MSESSMPAQAAAGTALSGSGNNYKLSDDLARLCLPQEFREPYRALAWVNSICCLFLVIGLVGLKPPKIHVRPISEPQDVVPVVFTPPEEQPQVQPEMKQDEPDQPQDTPEDTPQVAQVVAAADSAAVAFSVPVQGAVAIAPAAHLATPPPPTLQAPPRPVQFNPGVADGGYYPEPKYPAAALRNRYQGTVHILIAVDPTGKITEAKVQKTSGNTLLDDAALEVVQHSWRFPATGHPRLLIWPCIFQMN